MAHFRNIAETSDCAHHYELVAHIGQIVLLFCPKHHKQALKKAQRPEGQGLLNGVIGI